MFRFQDHVTNLANPQTIFELGVGKGGNSTFEHFTITLKDASGNTIGTEDALLADGTQVVVSQQEWGKVADGYTQTSGTFGAFTEVDVENVASASNQDPKVVLTGFSASEHVVVGDTQLNFGLGITDGDGDTFTSTNPLDVSLVGTHTGAGYQLTGTAIGRCLAASAGADTIVGNSTNDTVDYSNSTAGVTVNLTVNPQVSGGYASGDTLTGIDNILGSTFNDTLTGSSGANILIGGQGNDTLSGGGGNDTFKWMSGDGGTTATPAVDTVSDFSNVAGNTDRIDLSSLLIGETHPIDNSSAGNLADYLHFSFSGGNTILEISTTGAFAVSTETNVTALGAGFDQEIIFNGVNLVGASTDQNTIITNLLSSGRLLTDASATPVVLDLDHNGLQFVSLQDSNASFDYNGDGTLVHTAWVGGNDGILAYDPNGSGAANNGLVISFTHYAPGTSTDMQALEAAFDTNHDGVLNAQDAHFNQFGVWVDANGNGVVDPGEFHTLAQMGIASINLTSNGQSYLAANGDVLVSGESSYTMADGSHGIAGDVAFATNPYYPTSTITTASTTSTVVTAPIVLDLDHSGLQFISLQNSQAHFDSTGTGTSLHTAWVGPHNGILAFDANGDGAVNNGLETTFTHYAPNAHSNLEALAMAFDSNHDGVLDAKDAMFAKFGVWTDANSNGVSDPGEFHTLTQLGITSINLTNVSQASYTAANGDALIVGQTTFTSADGTLGLAGDVLLATSTNGQTASTASASVSSQVTSTSSVPLDEILTPADNLDAMLQKATTQNSTTAASTQNGSSTSNTTAVNDVATGATATTTAASTSSTTTASTTTAAATGSAAADTATTPTSNQPASETQTATNSTATSTAPSDHTSSSHDGAVASVPSNVAPTEDAHHHAAAAAA
ncbi:Hemolysin-type calcium-binding region [Chthoniobacter flavus Ellin428]|uniref:Hemolysin-type calcium-binding region n=1 Tax=Chthoniobacter flavus Ellin428 TaxID=497964 RepID=B4DAX8_9BACT|nr:type I secretion C-terminal target domain-containing protein [Chthoniobacter flavus]EDY16450.1 Hemolysin-type calcium-binding region [Chthoniobacter flavus Ellin428]